MNYYGTVIAVQDINISRKFYQDLFGLEVFQDYGRNIMFKGGLSLQQDFDWLASIPKDSVMRKSNNMELCFEEEQFDDFLERLKNYDVTYVSDVIEHDWGQRVIRFYDLDGHMIEVGENMKMVIYRFLSEGLSVPEVAKRMDISLKDLEQLMR